MLWVGYWPLSAVDWVLGGCLRGAWDVLGVCLGCAWDVLGSLGGHWGAWGHLMTGKVEGRSSSRSMMSFSTVWGGCAVDGVIAFVKTIHCHCIAGA